MGYIMGTISLLSQLLNTPCNLSSPLICVHPEKMGVPNDRLEVSDITLPYKSHLELPPCYYQNRGSFLPRRYTDRKDDSQSCSNNAKLIDNDLNLYESMLMSHDNSIARHRTSILSCCATEGVISYME